MPNLTAAYAPANLDKEKLFLNSKVIKFYVKIFDKHDIQCVLLE